MSDKNEAKGCLWVVAIVAYLIFHWLFVMSVGNSDLPDWYKFWLIS